MIFPVSYHIYPVFKFIIASNNELGELSLPPFFSSFLPKVSIIVCFLKDRLLDFPVENQLDSFFFFNWIQFL